MSKEARQCPICKKIYTDYPSLSRVDNKTEICPDCGQQEALDSIPKDTKPAFKFKETLYTKEDVKPLDAYADVTGMIVVLRADALVEKYRTPENQLWRATGGFGTKNFTIGRALFATCVYDSESARWNREQFMGVLKDQFAKEVETDAKEVEDTL